MDKDLASRSLDEVFITCRLAVLIWCVHRGRLGMCSLPSRPSSKAKWIQAKFNIGEGGVCTSTVCLTASG